MKWIKTTQDNVQFWARILLIALSLPVLLREN